MKDLSKKITSKLEDVDFSKIAPKRADQRIEYIITPKKSGSGRKTFVMLLLGGAAAVAAKKHYQSCSNPNCKCNDIKDKASEKVELWKEKAVVAKDKAAEKMGVENTAGDKLNHFGNETEYNFDKMKDKTDDKIDDVKDTVKDKADDFKDEVDKKF